MIVQKEQLFIKFQDISWEDLGEGVRRKVMGYGDQLMAVYIEMKRGATGALHSHPHLQISYIESGSLTVHIGSATQLLHRGDFYYIPANVKHGSEAMEDSILIDVFTPMRQEFVSLP
jgi:quercetin dioxygenase-like cupin family protein